MLLAAAEAAMVAHARSAAPAECCGLLVGDSRAIREALPARNIADDTSRRYVIDPQDHFAAIRHARQRSLEVVGAYHSHPRSPAVPSPTDAADAFSDFVFVIVGLATDQPDLRAWTWANGNFTALPLVRVQ